MSHENFSQRFSIHAVCAAQRGFESRGQAVNHVLRACSQRQAGKISPKVLDNGRPLQWKPKPEFFVRHFCTSPSQRADVHKIPFERVKEKFFAINGVSRRQDLHASCPCNKLNSVLYNLGMWNRQLSSASFLFLESILLINLSPKYSATKLHVSETNYPGRPVSRLMAHRNDETVLKHDVHRIAVTQDCNDLFVGLVHASYFIYLSTS